MHADEVDPHPTLGYVIPKGLFTDEKIYLAMLSDYNLKRPDGADYQNNGKLYENMYQAAGIKVLNLSGNWGITSIEDLSYFDFSEIEELNLSFNNLSGEIDLTKFTSLKKLNISNNKITGLKITGLSALTHIIANNNEISAVDLRGFRGSVVDLGMNKFTSLSDISLPSNTESLSYTVNLVNNNITTATTTINGGVAFNLGVQGIKQGTNSICDGEIKFYSMKDATIKAIVSGNGQTYSSIAYTDDVKAIALQPGKYTLKYVYVADDSDIWTGSEIYNTDTVWKTGYKPIDFVVRPETPTCKFFINGNERDSLLKIEKGTEIQINVAEGTTVYISSDGENWTAYDGGKIAVEMKTQTIYAKATQNEVDSELLSIHLVYEKEGIPIWLSIIFIALFVAGLIGAYYLVKKYIIDRGPSVQE